MLLCIFTVDALLCSKAILGVVRRCQGSSLHSFHHGKHTEKTDDVFNVVFIIAGKSVHVTLLDIVYVPRRVAGKWVGKIQGVGVSVVAAMELLFAP